MRDGVGASREEAVAEAHEYADPEGAEAAADLIRDIKSVQEPRAVVAGNIESWYAGPRRQDRNRLTLGAILTEERWTEVALRDLDDSSSRVAAQLPNLRGYTNIHAAVSCSDTSTAARRLHECLG